MFSCECWENFKNRFVLQITCGECFCYHCGKNWMISRRVSFLRRRDWKMTRRYPKLVPVGQEYVKNVNLIQIGKEEEESPNIRRLKNTHKDNIFEYRTVNNFFFFFLNALFQSKLSVGDSSASKSYEKSSKFRRL